jgi:hypothetical protein
VKGQVDQRIRDNQTLTTDETAIEMSMSWEVGCNNGLNDNPKH